MLKTLPKDSLAPISKLGSVEPSMYATLAVSALIAVAAANAIILIGYVNKPTTDSKSP